jgi:hypothetical protein
MSSGLLLIATAYRTVYGIIGGYITARLAPFRPMAHALVGGFMGLAANALGAIATWNQNLGPHWYPLALTVQALPGANSGLRGVRPTRAKNKKPEVDRLCQSGHSSVHGS